MTQPLSMFEKIWRRHTILEREDGAVLLHVGRNLVHDGTVAASPMMNHATIEVVFDNLRIPAGTLIGE
jgi:3-isopropylmalate/(R)-2-methylmalate dehydratase large subunit